MRLPSLAVSLSLLSSSVVNAALSNLQLRILPLGDSITAGATSYNYQGGYRRRLVQLLDGNYVNMVGSLSDGLFRDNNHEGWSGYGIAGPHNITEHYLYNGGRANPNVVILHAGTNDIFLSNSPSTVLGNLEQLMLDIRYLTPNAILILSHIGPWCPNTQNRNNIAAYNDGITNIVNKYRNMGWRIVLADVFGTLSASTDLTCDSNNVGVHPNPRGYDKMAQLYYNTLNAVQSSNPDWFSVPIGNSFGGTTGYYTCPKTSNAVQNFVNPWSVSNLANSQNQYLGMFCLDVQDNPNICYCSDPSGPNGSGYTYYIAKTRSCLEMTTTRTQAVIFADINGDGRDDYLYVGPAGQVTSWLVNNNTLVGSAQDNDQAGSVTVYNQGSIFGGVFFGNRTQVRFADLDGDGRAEYLQVLPNGVVNAFSPQPVYSTSDTQPGPGFPGKGQIFSGTYNNVAYPGAGLSFVDINGDSLADMVYTSFSGSVTVFQNLGASGNTFATFGSPQTVYSPPSGFNRDNVILRDMNGDGHADVVLLNRTSGAFRIYENLGTNGNSIASFNSTARYTANSGFDGSNGANIQFANVGGNGRADWININPSNSNFNIRSSQCVITSPGFGGVFTGFL